ncbi:class I SAM-dependent DNA methyltransferase [Deinococcus sp. SL84]|uniref:class I SAM-dependent DNA methyltransferase n=1 Tax=Deinococcus sp. SL84 TaxID=2994663 RepID=UPI0022758661|nr:N-6 DNA methylase [Deinococcus sp. SL84]MCY1704287.1 N-6 DNA methylase [Deinococcus sp. SL84]
MTTPKKKQKTKAEQTTSQRLSSVIKSVRTIMRKDKGLNGDADRLPMLTWLMFLKFLDDLEQTHQEEAEFEGRTYRPVLDGIYRWSGWAKSDVTGDDLLNFINQEKYELEPGKEMPGLLSYLRNLEGEGARDRRTVVAEIFRGVQNRMINGYLLKEVVQKLDTLDFTSSEESHTLGALYEGMLKEMRDAAGDAGEFYTPRAVVRFMVKALDPKLGEVVLDPASGTGGFLVEAFEHLKDQAKTTEELEVLQNRSVIGGEAKPLPYLLAQMNLTLHGMESPQIDSGNSLRFNLSEIGDRDRVDVILANPPFGGEEEKGIQNNFPADKRTNETALLFMQLIMRKLRRQTSNQRGGRAGVVVPNGFLFDASTAGIAIKKDLLSEFSLHTIVRLKEGVFSPYTDIPTNILFFERNLPSKDIWYYESPLPDSRKKYTKTKPIQFDEFAPLLNWWDNREENDRAWRVDVSAIAGNNYNLDIKNPNAAQDFEHMPPQELLADIMHKERRILELLEELQVELGQGVAADA